jgi:hypothetical protein
LKVAMEGTTHAQNFVVTYESITPNLPRCATTARRCRAAGQTACSTSSTPASSG